MKKDKVCMLFALLTLVVLTGCTATKSTTIKYDANGNITEKIESTQSAIKEITESTKGKTIVYGESGWAAGMSVSMATQENPTPTGKMYAGKVDKVLISALPNQNWEGMEKVILATKYELRINKDGFSNGAVTNNAGTATTANTAVTPATSAEASK